MTIERELESLGLAYEIKRNKVWLKDMDVCRVLQGYPLSFTRRRYGRSATFCWVQYYDRECSQWFEIAEPWQAVTPSAASMLEAISLDIAYRKKTQCTNDQTSSTTSEPTASVAWRTAWSMTTEDSSMADTPPSIASTWRNVESKPASCLEERA